MLPRMVIWRCWNGAGQINAHGMNVHALMLHGTVTLSCCNGAGQINAHEMNVRVSMLLWMVTLSYWNGPEQINAHGMNERAPMLPSMVTMSCWNGQGQMGVLGTEEHMQLQKGRGILIWCNIWKMQDAQSSNKFMIIILFNKTQKNSIKIYFATWALWKGSSNNTKLNISQTSHWFLLE